MIKDLKEILLSQEQIKQRVTELGKEVTKVYKGKNPVLICILKGAIVFYADLCRVINIPIRMEFVSLSSYGNSAVSSNSIIVHHELLTDPKDQDIIIVEDIVDTGLTMQTFKNQLLDANAKSVAICSLLNKPEMNKLHIDYIGFDIGNDFVVGYGLDYAEKYRNLPYICILKKEIYT